MTVSSLRSNARLRQPPQQPMPIDWSNPITRGLAFAYVIGANGGHGFGEDGRNLVPYMIATYVTAAPIVTNVGFAAKVTNTTYPILSVAQRSIVSGAYSLFAVATSTTSTGAQSAIDDDDGTTRRFQFRLNAGAVEFIPFNSSGVAGSVAGSAMSAATLLGGFTMGAVATSTTSSVWTNGKKTSAAASGILAPTTPIWIGNRKTSATPWNNGGMSLAAMWNRALTDAEMASLSANPWQIFKTISNVARLATLAGMLSIPRFALYRDSNGDVKQRPSGLNVKPLALINGVLQPQTNNQTPVILVNGQLRQLKSGESIIT